jgi:hypothetical protein
MPTPVDGLRLAAAYTWRAWCSGFRRRCWRDWLIRGGAKSLNSFLSQYRGTLTSVLHNGESLQPPWRPMRNAPRAASGGGPN